MDWRQKGGTMEKIKPPPPAGMDDAIPCDTTTFVNAGINAVNCTLVEAGALVLIVIQASCQGW